jgi:DNA processing protein
MSGLTLGTVVIEATDRSGSLIQARKALEQGRKRFIPRSAMENRSVTWPRTAVSQGAHVFASIDDLIERLHSCG